MSVSTSSLGPLGRDWRADKPTGYIRFARSDILRWFESDHLSESLRGIVVPFERLANAIEDDIEPSAEKATCLRKLLEAKDAAVRCGVMVLDRRAEEENTN